MELATLCIHIMLVNLKRQYISIMINQKYLICKDEQLFLLSKFDHSLDVPSRQNLDWKWLPK